MCVCVWEGGGGGGGGVGGGGGTSKEGKFMDQVSRSGGSLISTIGSYILSDV